MLRLETFQICMLMKNVRHVHWGKLLSLYVYVSIFMTYGYLIAVHWCRKHPNIVARTHSKVSISKLKIYVVHYLFCVMSGHFKTIPRLHLWARPFITDLYP